MLTDKIQCALFGISINILLQTCATAQTLYKEFDTNLFTVKIYVEKVSPYGDAEQICSNIGAILVQLNDIEVRNAVYDNKYNATSGYYWLGAKRDETPPCPIGDGAINCKWNWVDGTPVNMNIDWEDDQPDNNGGEENRLVILRDNKFIDAAPNFLEAGTICQKHKHDPCQPNPCKNDGSCSITYSDPYYRCDCADSFYGNTCSENYCQHNPNLCKNGESCLYHASSPYYECHCTAGYYGDTCNKNYCQHPANPCQNDGNCALSELSPYYKCDCTGGYYGDTCTENYCQHPGNPCQNGGSCSLFGSSPYYKCDCTDGYYGDICDDEYCQHYTNTCQNGGNCSSLTSSPYYKCDCADNGYYGDACDENFCQRYPNTCKNGGSCLNTTASPYYSCDCADGYYADTCDKMYCQHHPNTCQNGGSCSSTTSPPYYKCNCVDGFYEDTCIKFISITSNEEAIGVVGAFANIDVNVTTNDEPLTIDVYKDIMSNISLQKQTNIGNGTTSFIFEIKTTEDEGMYIFFAYPESMEYTRNTSTSLIVHVNASVDKISQSFIFSPITNGSSEVKCRVSGMPPPTVSWYRSDGSPIINSTSKPGVYQTFNSTNAILHVHKAVLDDDGVYTCNATNNVGENMTNVFDANVTQLAVYGRPSIEQVLAKECSPNGSLTIGWAPNDQTTKVLHRFTVESINATMKENFTKFATIDETEVVEFNNLMPWTQYNILIEVCPDACIPNFNKSDVKTTGHGLPGKVINSNVNLDEDLNQCVVEWDIPDTPGDQITEYTISVMEEYVYEPTQEGTTSIENNNLITIPAPKLSYQHDTKPNKNYMFHVTARTCAGSGDAATATGKCTTKSSGPSEVPEAVIENTGAASTTRPITIPLADETNRPISCTFVIVNRGNNVNSSRNFGIEELEDAANAAFSGGDGDYIAIAIPREKVEGNEFEANLGDNEESQCDISLLFNNKNRTRRNVAVDGNVIKGKNLPLKTDGTAYAVYPVATTPVTGEESLVTIGIFVSFTNGSPSLAWIGGAVALALIVIAAFYFWRRRNPDTKDVDDQRRVSLNHGVVLPIVPMQRDTIYENVDYENLKTATDIPFTTLQQRFNILRANECMQFCVQYQNLKAKAKAAAPPTTLGGSEEMMPKNRYKNILPYDSTRVVLEGDGIDGYINACYVTGHDKTFIATQGPLPNTVIDFWRMVTEQNCKVIVMLTKCEEAGRRKCQQYWPGYNQSMYYGDISVKNQDERHFGGYVKRTFHVSWQMSKKLTVNQYHFVKWPDHGVPKTTSAFFRFHKTVMENYRETGEDAPMLVHCSAGVGRTGAFIGYDILQGQAANKTSVDIYNCVLSMRKERIDMVQTCNQYELLHKFMLERYLFGETDMGENEIRTGFEDGKSFPSREQVEKEFALLREAGSLADKRDEDQGAVPALRDRVVIVRQPEDTE